MAGPIYGSITGPDIPKSVDQGKKLSLGKHTLILGAPIIKESRAGDSMNISYPCHVEGKSGSAFLRLNFRHKPFTVGAESFGQADGYMDPDFLATGLDRLKELTKSDNREVAAEASKELFRANQFLSEVKKLKNYAGDKYSESYGGAFAPEGFSGASIQGLVRYVDADNNTKTENKGGTVVCRAKNPKTGKWEEVFNNTFNTNDFQAEVYRILYCKNEERVEEEELISV